MANKLKLVATTCMMCAIFAIISTIYTLIDVNTIATIVAKTNDYASVITSTIVNNILVIPVITYVVAHTILTTNITHGINIFVTMLASLAVVAGIIAIICGATNIAINIIAIVCASLVIDILVFVLVFIANITKIIVVSVVAVAGIVIVIVIITLNNRIVDVPINNIIDVATDNIVASICIIAYVSAYVIHVVNTAITANIDIDTVAVFIGSSAVVVGAITTMFYVGIINIPIYIIAVVFAHVITTIFEYSPCLKIFSEKTNQRLKQNYKL